MTDQQNAYSHETYSEATEALDEARAAYEQFQEHLAELGRQVRRIDPHQHARFDAYPGWTGNRDVGAGQGMMEWLDEVAVLLGVDEDPDDC